MSSRPIRSPPDVAKILGLGLDSDCCRLLWEIFGASPGTKLLWVVSTSIDFLPLG